MNLESLLSVRYAVSALYGRTLTPETAERAYYGCDMCVTLQIYMCTEVSPDPMKHLSRENYESSWSPRWLGGH